MRRSSLAVILLVLCLTALPGCQALLDALAGNVPSGLGGGELGPGGNVTVKLINQAGVKTLVDAAYTTSDTQVRHTVRILDAAGPAAQNTILSTRTQFLDILAKVDPSVDPLSIRGNLHPGDVLAVGHFVWGVDFANNDVLTFTIPSPVVPPADITDCDDDGVADSEEIATCTSNPACDDCNGNAVPDGCDIETGASHDCNGNGIPDECDIASGTSEDCQPNGIPDECDIGELVPAIIQGDLVAHPLLGGTFTVQNLGDTLSPTDLVNTLVGAGVNVSNVQFTGDLRAAGRFSGAQSAIGFDGGIVLSTGLATEVVGPNQFDDQTYSFNLPGDTDLDAILFPTSQPTTQPTHDAAVLEFDFSCELNNVIQFRYVFSSEEYNEYVDSFYNDVFAFFLNGQNIAIVPGTESTAVSISSINCGQFPGKSDGPNCNLFINNEIGSGQGLNTEMDGLTVVLTASAQLQPGPNHIKIAIADTTDTSLDSAVFLQSVSFVCQIPRGACCNRLTNTCTDEVLESECQGEFMTWSSGLACSALDPPCYPVPQGGCCLPGAECLVTSEQNCAALGGCYLGVESDCASATCTNGQSVDCDANGIPDECQILSSNTPGS